MRQAFIDQLTKMARDDESVYLLTADAGFKVFDEYQREFRLRYLNPGICEAAIIGVSAGLALAGKKVFVYGIIPFVTMRCLEQIRVDLCAENLPVRIVGVGQGLTYGSEGMTHHSIEDIALMACLPNMTIVCPGDPVETAMAIDAAYEYQGPIYFRLGKSGEPVVHSTPPASFQIGKGIVLSAGADLALLATGNMLATTVLTAQLLAGKGVSPTVVSLHTIKPLDVELIRRLSVSHRMIVTIEEHSGIGGLGSMVGNLLSELSYTGVFNKYSLPDAYVYTAGGHEYFRRQFGLTPERLAENILARFQESEWR